MRTDKILAAAEFDERLPKYFLLVSTLTMIGSFIGIPLVPFWVLWIGPKIHRKQYEALSAILTDRSLNISKGFLFKTQKNIPLDKITDLAVNEGPVLRYLGLCSLQIETAGGGQGTQMGHASLPGVVDALKFRDAVLEQRDLVSGTAVVPSAAPAAATTVDDGVETSRDLLVEIRDILSRLEKRDAK